ncbi:hypothetical protein EVAR_65420_1 [Eumeta japonica]|uniref:Uncharacterized protein n=1 Tax=Eumeta variegata TaxID=151549 RepID=A0A4C1YI70_EUMVA|nr:hypothetical protein EVAR_65420_1 [Eumeta japonica]
MFQYKSLLVTTALSARGSSEIGIATGIEVESGPELTSSNDVDVYVRRRGHVTASLPGTSLGPSVRLRCSFGNVSLVNAVQLEGLHQLFSSSDID